MKPILLLLKTKTILKPVTLAIALMGLGTASLHSQEEQDDRASGPTGSEAMGSNLNPGKTVNFKRFSPKCKLLQIVGDSIRFRRINYTLLQTERSLDHWYPDVVVAGSRPNLLNG